MAIFWSLVAFVLTGVLIWLIFFADDDKVLTTMRIPLDKLSSGDGGKTAAVAAVETPTFDTLSAPARMQAIETEADAEVRVTEAAAATAEAAVAVERADATAGQVTTEEERDVVEDAQEAFAAADATIADAVAATETATAASLDATDRAQEDAMLAEGQAAIAADAEVSQLTAAETELDEVAVDAFAGTDVAPLPKTANYPDNLIKINGIGEVYQRRLYEQGIYTWAQIAALDATELARMTEAIEAARVDEWPAQAQQLAEANGRTNAEYHGPMPDRLTSLPGIGEKAQETLREHGIITYEQLKEADPAVIEATLRAAGVRADVQAAIGAARNMGTSSS